MTKSGTLESGKLKVDGGWWIVDGEERVLNLTLPTPQRPNSPKL
jgi:hypothetical protein